ncbi:single-stranded DNA-binding protein, partial [Streptococcus canis]
IWGKAAENLVNWTDKGTLISLEGELRTRNYEKDGQRHFVMEVWSTFFQVLSKPANDN